MIINPLFGYVLGHDAGPYWSVSWANTSYVLYGFVPRKDIRACGVAILLGPHNSGNFSATVFAMYGPPLWTTPEVNLDGAYTRRVVSVPTSNYSFYRLKIEFPDVNLAGGCQYYVSLKHTSSSNIPLFFGPYLWPTRLNAHPYNYAGVVTYNNGSWSPYARVHNAQILYRMPDGTAKAFEPLVYNWMYVHSYQNPRVRFSVYGGLNVRVEGVVLSHIVRNGSPGQLSVRLRQGTTVLTESYPMPAGFTPPADDERKHFYIAFQDSVLLESGVDYDLEMVVGSPNDSTNNYSWRCYEVDITDIHPWWTYRMVINGVEDRNKVPPSLLFALDPFSPFS